MLQPLQDPSKRFFDQVVITPSYLIFKIGDIVYAKNGLTGQIEFSGKDAGAVVQSVINAMSPYEKVVLKGDLVFNSPVNILKPITYQHDGAMILNVPSGEAGIVIGGSTTRVDRCDFYVYEIDGQDKTRDAIKILNGAFNRFSFVRVHRCRYAFYLKQETTNVVLGENYFHYVSIGFCKKGLYIPAPPTGQTAVWAEGTQLHGGMMLYNDEHGVLVENGANAGGMLITGVIDNADVAGAMDYVNNMDSDRLGSTLVTKFIRVAYSTFHPKDIVINPESCELYIGDMGRIRFRDAEIRREGPGLLQLPHPLVLRSNVAIRHRPTGLTEYVEETWVDGVTTYVPYQKRCDGRMEWGSGNAPPDVVLYRAAANLLSLDSGDGFRVPGAVRTYVKAGIPTDADIPNAEDGAIIIDSVNSRIYVRVGGIWKYVALT